VFLASNGINPPATQSFTLTINESPGFNSENTASITVGELIEIDITATGYPSPAIAMDGTSDPLPDNLAFTPGTGAATLSGTPVVGTGGIYHLVFSASNGIVPDDVQSFTLIIETVEEIDNSGGTITSNNETISIEVPAGAVSDEIVFTFVPQAEPTESAGSLSFAGISFQLSAKEKISGEIVNTFEEPLVVTVYYDEEALGDINEDSLILYYWDETLEEWLDALCPDAEYERNFEENWFRLSICHLTEFAVMGQSGYQTFLPLIMR